MNFTPALRKEYCRNPAPASVLKSESRTNPRVPIMKRSFFPLMIPLTALLALSAGTSKAQQLPKVPDDVEMLRNVEFGKGGNQRLTMHILRPKISPREP